MSKILTFKFVNLFLHNAFVNISASCKLDWQCCILIKPSRYFSWIKWYLISICLRLLLTVPFLNKDIALKLSMIISQLITYSFFRSFLPAQWILLIYSIALLKAIHTTFILHKDTFYSGRYTHNIARLLLKKVFYGRSRCLNSDRWWHKFIRLTLYPLRNPQSKKDYI